MDLFPVGGFVRMRNRARDKYVHADEDASGVSLRPLGAAPSMNAVWKVEHWPVEGGDAFFLLQGAAYGLYLAVSNEDEDAPSGHRGVRIVQADFDSLNPKDPFVWTANRVEAGQNYVYLRNHHLYLRANGRHSYRNNLVTADARSDNKRTQWKVEAIPSTSEQRPLPSPPEPPEGSCCACGREDSAALCRRCAERMKDKLLGPGAKRRMDEERAQKHCYCLECHNIFTGIHMNHPDKSIQLGHYNKQCVAWLSGEESWRAIFEAIETEDRAIRPYQLFRSTDDRRCDICQDIVSTDRLYGVLLKFCSLSCYVAGGGDQDTVEKAIVSIDFSTSPIGFCLTCMTPDIQGKAHSNHNWLRIICKDSAGLRPRVVIPDGHLKQQDWALIKKEGSAGNEVVIRDDSSVRCNGCQKRLASAGNSCSIQCSLGAACRQPHRFLPRALRLSTSLGAVAKTA